MIGSYRSSGASNRLSSMVHRVFGVPDFHSHLRLKWLDRYLNLGNVSLCELGCGSGINLTELVLRNSGAIAVGYEGDRGEVDSGMRFADKLGLTDRVKLKHADLRVFFPEEVSSADVVLLIDVLEHLPNPKETAERIVSAMKPGAMLLVSVPTPLFPKIFGRRFHENIGHLHDGFRLRELDAFFSGLQRKWHKFSTGPLSWPGVFIYYRVPSVGRRAKRLINAAKLICSIPFRYLDGLNGPPVSCSVFAEYRKI